MRPRYDTDLTDEQWLKISSLYPEANHRGRPRTQNFREITNAILYLVRAGCAGSGYYLTIFLNGRRFIITSVAGKKRESGKKFMIR